MQHIAENKRSDIEKFLGWEDLDNSGVSILNGQRFLGYLWFHFPYSREIFSLNLLFK